MTESKNQRSISLDVTDGRVRVTVRDSRSGSTAVVQRSDDAALVSHVPIGSRKAEHLNMVLDDVPVKLKPGPGRITRGSYKVTAVYGGVIYLLRPKDSTASRLVRNGTTLGELRRVSDNEVKAWWQDGVEVSVTDVAMGYALAAAFGTGARFFLLAFLETGAETTPG